MKEITMATIKSFTDIEQSKKLAEILPIESADMCWYLATKGNPKAMFNEGYSEYGDFELPCWSLAALLAILPEIQGGKPIISLDDNYITYPHMSDLHTKADNIVDACVAMIEKLNELNML